jgi:tetratricopeptide (TPR) repeat protein
METKEQSSDEALFELVEKKAATAVIAEVLSGPSAWWRERARRTPGVVTHACAALLIERSIALMDQSPADATDAAAVAVDVAEQLRPDAYPSGLVLAVRTDAWREYAYSLFYVGRLSEASTAIDAAEQTCRRLPSPEHGLARISLIRAQVYRGADRFDEAIALAAQAAETFARLGDQTRYAKARVTEGNMRHARGDVAAALTIWLAVEDAPGLAHDGTLGMVLHNIGYAYRDLGDYALARTYLGRARAQYETRGMAVEKVRTRWAEGGMLVMSGEAGEGLRILREAWRAFEKVGMELEAALVGLEVAEALLVTGDTDEVPSICRAILDRFVSEGMTSRAITALSFLREAIAVGKAPPDLVRTIHSFLRALPDGAKSTSIHPSA